MLLAVSLYAGEYTGIDVNHANIFRWISLGLSLPALLYSAQPFFKGAWSGAAAWDAAYGFADQSGNSKRFCYQPNGDDFGTRGSLLRHADITDLSCCCPVAWLLNRATKWAMGSSEKLLDLEPRTARIVHEVETHEVSISSVQLGNRLRVLPGETIPVDGVLESDFAVVGEAHLTGESEAVRKKAGDALYTGSNVEQSPLEMTATAVGETTRLARLAQMMKETSSQRAPIVALHDRVAGYFVATVLLLALITGAIWLMIDPSRALWNAAALVGDYLSVRFGIGNSGCTRDCDGTGGTTRIVREGSGRDRTSVSSKACDFG